MNDTNPETIDAMLAPGSRWDGINATFAQWLETLHQQQYTGPVLFQFGQGVPNEMQLLAVGTRFRLTKAARKAHACRQD